VVVHHRAGHHPVGLGLGQDSGQQCTQKHGDRLQRYDALIALLIEESITPTRDG
jgi:hypothetical protein